jgi:hypothetical protein
MGLLDRIEHELVRPALRMPKQKRAFEWCCGPSSRPEKRDELLSKFSPASIEFASVADVYTCEPDAREAALSPPLPVTTRLQVASMPCVPRADGTCLPYDVRVVPLGVGRIGLLVLVVCPARACRTAVRVRARALSLRAGGREHQSPARISFLIPRPSLGSVSQDTWWEGLSNE